MKILKIVLVVFAFIVLQIVFAHDFKGFDDTILFKINWPGSLEDELLGQGQEIMNVVTPNMEKYQCNIPALSSKSTEETDQYHGFSPLQLLAPLFFPQLCSYRVESYWTYEVCHGQYVRQYHEEREGKKVKLQDYYLGRWDSTKQKKLEEQMAQAEENGEKLKYKKIDGVNLPYVEFEMDDGTICDLNNKPRMTKVQYVCSSNRKHEVYTFKETSTCEYEVIILSPLLCAHPKYKPKDSEENVINCLPVEGAPKMPRSVLAMEVESMRYNQKILENKAGKDVLAVIKVEHNEDGEARVKMELHPIDYEETIKESLPAPSIDPPPVFQNNDLVRAFLDGENCLEGGTGWWKYDFCYGRHVKQVHVDEKTGFQTSVLLGEFNEENHLNWMIENPHKRPKAKGQRQQISHFYSGGEPCAQTRKERQTEVKLKCLENASSPSQVSLYLLEPKICQYILGIESPLICEILDMADDNGLIKWPQPFPVKQPASTATEEKETNPAASESKIPKKRDETFANDEDYDNNE